MISVLILDINETKPLHSCPLSEAGDRDPRIFLLRKGLDIFGAQSLADRLTAGMLVFNRYGKPSLKAGTDFFFNLSHSGSYLAGAFSDREIGVDIQKISPAHSDLLHIAKRFFTREEYEKLAAAVNPDEQLMLFFCLWSIKEAYLKYCGCGLQGNLDSFLIDPMPKLPAGQKKQKGSRKGSLYVLKNEPMLSPAQYSLLSGPPGYTLAVSAEAIPDQIEIRYLEENHL